MRGGGASRISDCGDNLSPVDFHSFSGIIFFGMGINGKNSPFVGDDSGVSVSSHSAAEDDYPRSGSDNGGSAASRDIDTLMGPSPALAKVRADAPACGNRPGQIHGSQESIGFTVSAAENAPGKRHKYPFVSQRGVFAWIGGAKPVKGDIHALGYLAHALPLGGEDVPPTLHLGAGGSQQTDCQKK